MLLKWMVIVFKRRHILTRVGQAPPLEEILSAACSRYDGTLLKASCGILHLCISGHLLHILLWMHFLCLLSGGFLFHASAAASKHIFRLLAFDFFCARCRCLCIQCDILPIWHLIKRLSRPHFLLLLSWFFSLALLYQSFPPMGTMLHSQHNWKQAFEPLVRPIVWTRHALTYTTKK